jgi:hypothetical protein
VIRNNEGRREYDEAMVTKVGRFRRKSSEIEYRAITRHGLYTASRVVVF